MKKIALTLMVLTTVFLANAGENVPASATAVVKVEKDCVCGKIVDKQSAETLAGVAVQYNENNKVYTDLEGKFSIPKSKLAENSTLTVRLISYEDAEVKIDLKSNESLTIALSQR